MSVDCPGVCERSVDASRRESDAVHVDPDHRSRRGLVGRVHDEDLVRLAVRVPTDDDVATGSARQKVRRVLDGNVHVSPGYFVVQGALDAVQGIIQVFEQCFGQSCGRFSKLDGVVSVRQDVPDGLDDLHLDVDTHAGVSHCDIVAKVHALKSCQMSILFRLAQKSKVDFQMLRGLIDKPLLHQRKCRLFHGSRGGRPVFRSTFGRCEVFLHVHDGHEVVHGRPG